jgi:hypothetical protein
MISDETLRSVANELAALPVVPTRSDPFVQHFRFDPSCAETMVSRLYPWLRDETGQPAPPVVINLFDELRRRPGSERLHLRHRALAKERGWGYVLLPAPWCLPREGQQGDVAAVPARRPRRDLYDAGSGDYG